MSLDKTINWMHSCSLTHNNESNDLDTENDACKNNKRRLEVEEETTSKRARAVPQTPTMSVHQDLVDATMSVTALNQDIWGLILSELSLSDVLVARQTCQQVKTICDRFLIQDKRPERPDTKILVPVGRPQDMDLFSDPNKTLFHHLMLPSVTFEVQADKMTHHQALSVIESLSHRPVRLFLRAGAWKRWTWPNVMPIFGRIHDLVLQSCVIEDHILPILAQIPSVELCGCKWMTSDLTPLAGNQLESLVMDDGCWANDPHNPPLFPTFPKMAVNLTEVEMDLTNTETNGDWTFFVRDNITPNNVQFLQTATGKLRLIGSDSSWMEDNFDIYSLECSSLTLEWDEEFHYLLQRHPHLQTLRCYNCAIDNRFRAYPLMREVYLLVGTLNDCNLTFRFPNLEVFHLTQEEPFHDPEDETVHFILHDMPRLHTVSMRVPSCMTVQLHRNQCLTKLTIGPTTRVDLQDNPHLTQIELEGPDVHEQELQLATTLKIVHVPAFDHLQFIEKHIYEFEHECRRIQVI